ncbi:MAG: ROK family protein [Bacteriovoracaceae bacterium]
MKNEQLAFGIDIGGTNTKIGLLNSKGELLNFKTLPSLHAEDPTPFIEQIYRECSEILNSNSLSFKNILGLGVGAPMANYFSGRIESAPNLGWKNVALKNIFEEIFNVKTFIENDANLAALGEKKWGAGKSMSDFILITLGTGVGSGLILENKLYRGHNGLGGEGGHILIPSESERPCSCGGINHLESFLSAKGIKKTITELIHEEWSIEKLGQLYKNNDPKALLIMNKITDQLVSGLMSMSVLFAPEAFIIGGGVSKLGKDFDKLIEKKLNEKIHFSLKGKIQVLPASVSAEQGAIFGGAAMVFNEVIL